MYIFLFEYLNYYDMTNLGWDTGLDGSEQPVKIQGGTWDWTGQGSLSKSGTGQSLIFS